MSLVQKPNSINYSKPKNNDKLFNHIKSCFKHASMAKPTSPNQA